MFAALVTALVFWVIKQGISVRWWEWLIGTIGIALLIFTVQNFLGSFVENEPKAAWMFWIVLGLPSLIILAIPTVLVIMRRKNA
ncbi:MAG: dehalogenase [Chloroflexi bacterium]|nr:dehalogenase [Chloroflexota bacterium]